MNFIKKHRGKIIFAIIAILLLMISFFFSGNVPEDKSIASSDITEKNETDESKEKKAPEIMAEDEKKNEIPVVNEEKKQPVTEKISESENKNIPETKMENAPESVRKNADESDKKMTEQVTDEQNGQKEEPLNPALEGNEAKPNSINGETPVKALYCTLGIKCDTLLNKRDGSDEKNSGLIPDDGVIFPEKEVLFYEGESVFNVLMREMKKAKIHMEYTSAPIYNSAYIEGIGNIYEFDFGELSGWMYKVNDYFPNFGSSRYQLKEGDKVWWVYTCDLGKDVGGSYSARNGYNNE